MNLPERLLTRATPILQQARLRPAPGLPDQVHLSVTDRCFLPCAHCDIWKNKTVDLPEATWLNVLDQMGAWLGKASVNFVGGEPLLRKDLERLMTRATTLGFDVSFNTNGWLLDDRRAEGLADAGARIAYLSMDGFRAETIDRSRGRVGTQAKLLEVCDRLDKRANPRVVIACILHAENAAEIPDLLHWVKERGYELVVQPLYQNFGENAHDPSWWRSSPLWPTTPDQLSRIDHALDVLIDERSRWGKVCNEVAQLRAFKHHFHNPGAPNGQTCKAGHSDIAFDPAGNVRLCYFLEPVGNLSEGVPVASMWNRLGALRRRYEVSRCTRSCNLLNCNFDAPG